MIAAGASNPADASNFHATGRSPIDAPNRYLAVITPFSESPRDGPAALDFAEAGSSALHSAAQRRSPPDRRLPPSA